MKFYFAIIPMPIASIIIAFFEVRRAAKSPDTLNITISIICLIASITAVTCYFLDARKRYLDQISIAHKINEQTTK